MSIVKGPLTASRSTAPRREPVSREGVHTAKERTSIKEGFKLEFTDEEKKLE